MKIYYNNYKDQVEKRLNSHKIELIKANTENGGWIVEDVYYATLNDIVDGYRLRGLKHFR